MYYKPVAEVTAFFGWNYLPQCHLHLLRLLYIVDKTYPVSKPYTVCIRHNCRLTEHISHYKISTLTSHTRKLEQFIKVIRHGITILFVQHLHTCAYIACLASAKSTWTHDILYVINISFCKCSHTWVFVKKSLNHNINSRVSALCRKAYTYKQLPCIIIIKRTGCIRVFIFQFLYNLKSKLLLSHMCSFTVLP